MPILPECDLFILTGEASGDAYGGAVLRELIAVRGAVDCAAMGGAALKAAGAEIEQGIDGLSVMGFIPVLKRLPEFAALGRRVEATIRARRPRVVLSIDYPGFNLRLQRRLADLRSVGTRLVHVVAPQVWAWRPRRAKRIASSVDRLLCFFPFEPRLFSRFGCRADFVGHPLVDMLASPPSTRRVERELGLAAGDRLLVLAPGSREREVAGLLPVFHAAAERARAHLPTPGGRTVIAISKAPELPLEIYRNASYFPLVEDEYCAMCARGHCAAIASGTATLEAALLGLPHAIAYRGDHLSATLMRHLLVTPHIGLPNIVHGHRVVPELLQEELNVERLAARLVALWGDVRQRECRATLSTTAEVLGGGGAMRRIASIIDEELRIGQRRPDSVG